MALQAAIYDQTYYREQLERVERKLNMNFEKNSWLKAEYERLRELYLQCLLEKQLRTFNHG